MSTTVLDYEQRLREVLADLEEAEERAQEIVQEIRRASDSLIHEESPGRIIAYHNDPVKAGEHVQSTLAKLTEINVAAGKAAKSIRSIGEIAEHIHYSGEVLFKRITTAADEEEARRNNKQVGMKFSDADKLGDAVKAGVEKAKKKAAGKEEG
jgi:hypothetical protein